MAPTEPMGSVPRVLVIDDEPGVAEFASTILSLHGEFESLPLSDVTLWDETINKFRPDVVIVDFSMPKMMGDRLIKAIRASKHANSIRAIALFSATPFTVDQIQNMGADAFFEKPFDIDVFLKDMRNLARRPLPEAGEKQLRAQ